MCRFYVIRIKKKLNLRHLIHKIQACHIIEINWKPVSDTIFFKVHFISFLSFVCKCHHCHSYHFITIIFRNFPSKYYFSLLCIHVMTQKRKTFFPSFFISIYIWTGNYYWSWDKPWWMKMLSIIYRVKVQSSVYI